MIQYRHLSNTLSVGGKSYHLLIVTTPAAQAKGLGGRPSLPLNEAMLFPFSDAGFRCFWMKDMQFPIDIVWLNSQKQIVHIEPNVSPATYPAAFCPSEPAQYVLELNAGQAAEATMYEGRKLNF